MRPGKQSLTDRQTDTVVVYSILSKTRRGKGDCELFVPYTHL